MSRIGKLPVELPNGVTAQWDASARILTVKGPKGELKQEVHALVSLDIQDNQIVVTVEKPDLKFQRALWGTFRALIFNMVVGVTEGFTKSLELNGVGFKMELGSELTLHVGYSHPVKVTIPSEIKLQLNKNVLSGTSIDKQILGDFFTKVHNIRPCDVYKHKGFKFPGRYYRKKVAKKSK